MWYIMCHAYEAFMMWGIFISILSICSPPITGVEIVTLLYFPPRDEAMYTVGDLQASNNEANSFHMSYFKPRVSKGTYIKMMSI